MKHHYYFLLITLFTISSYSQNCNVTNEFDFVNNGTINLHLGQSFVACQSGTLESIGVLIAANSSSTGETINFYNGVSITPGNLLGSITNQTLTENGGAATNYDITDFSSLSINVVSGQTYNLCR